VGNHTVRHPSHACTHADGSMDRGIFSHALRHSSGPRRKGEEVSSCVYRAPCRTSHLIVLHVRSRPEITHPERRQAPRNQGGRGDSMRKPRSGSEFEITSRTVCVVTEHEEEDSFIGGSRDETQHRGCARRLHDARAD
jgi:hypothetical protein